MACHLEEAERLRIVLRHALGAGEHVQAHRHLLRSEGRAARPARDLALHVAALGVEAEVLQDLLLRLAAALVIRHAPPLHRRAVLAHIGLHCGTWANAMHPPARAFVSHLAVVSKRGLARLAHAQPVEVPVSEHHLRRRVPAQRRKRVEHDCLRASAK